MKTCLTLLLLISAFTSNAQRTMFGGQNNYAAPVIPFQAPAVVTSGLVLLLDAANPASYPGTGTTWTDLSSSTNVGTLIDHLLLVHRLEGRWFLMAITDIIIFQ